MSKKIVLAISGICTALIIIYMGYEAITYQSTDNTLIGFLQIYLNNTQKYIFNGMVYGMPVFIVCSIRFFAPEVLTRLKENIFFEITERSIEAALTCAGDVVGMHIIVAFVAGFSMVFSLEIMWIFIRLAIFYVECQFMMYFIYVRCKKMALSAVITIAINMLFLLLLSGCNFAVERLDQSSMLSAFLLYECFGAVCCGIGLSIAIKRRDADRWF